MSPTRNPRNTAIERTLSPNPGSTNELTSAVKAMKTSTPGRPGGSIRIPLQARRTQPSGPFRNHPAISSALFSTVLLNSSPTKPTISNRRRASRRLPPTAPPSALTSSIARTDSEKLGSVGPGAGPAGSTVGPGVASMVGPGVGSSPAPGVGVASTAPAVGTGDAPGTALGEAIAGIDCVGDAPTLEAGVAVALTVGFGVGFGVFVGAAVGAVEGFAST